MEKMLKRLTQKFQHGEQGFTLIEILIVIVILGVLVAVAIPQVTKFVGQSKVSAANAELASVNKSIGVGMVDAGVITVTPGNIDPANDFQIDTAAAGSDTGEDVWAGYYIQGSSGGDPATGTAETVIPIKGTNTIDGAGKVTSATYPDGPTWDVAANNFQ